MTFQQRIGLRRFSMKPFVSIALLETPTIALQNVRLEIARMGDLAGKMLTGLREAMIEGDRNKLTEVKDRDDPVG